MMYDIVIIGAGVTGSAIARELSRYQANICVLEKGDTYVQGHQKPTVALCIPDLTQNREH